MTTTKIGNGLLPSHRGMPSVHINKDRLTSAPPKSSPWLSRFYVPIPGSPGRFLTVVLPIPSGLATILRNHFARPRMALITLFIGLLVFVNVSMVLKKANARRTPGESIVNVITDVVTGQDTVVFNRDEIRRIYEWEIWGGNHPTRRRIPAEVGIPHDLYNPSVPPRDQLSWPAPSEPPFLIDGADNATIGTGPTRVYFAPQAPPRNLAYPPRPEPGSMADLDKITQYCDFDTKQYVRDCLEVMKVGGGLDNGNRLRRGKTDQWHYIFREDPATAVMPKHIGKDAQVTWTADPKASSPGLRHLPQESIDYKDRHITQARVLTPSATSAVDMCDPERPRIFHMYWSGPFTDKPYLILMSYLFTQPLDFHIPSSGSRPTNTTSPCRPQFWVWVNPGVQGSVPNPDAKRDLFNVLAANPWSAPFLHKRFHDVVKFKMWNTTERLDFHPELSDWRTHDVLGKLAIDEETAAQLLKSKGLLNKIAEGEDGAEGGDQSPMDAAAQAAMVQLKAADSAQVVMSDLARFLVTHTYGGIYLDVDHVLLRDWEELWNWRGAFAMRWSLHPWYNTAVMKMQENSAIGSFLLRTAIKNDDRQPFHPEAITHYMRDAKLEPLIFRIPDALFDPNFLNMEKEQRDRPPFPAYSWDSGFGEFFQTPARTGYDAQAGFSAFFRGAYAYHWHNNWEKPVDSGRNFPDLGERFEEIAKIARKQHVASVMSKMPASSRLVDPESIEKELSEDSVANDDRDLSWSAVLKRTFEAYIRGEQPNMYGEWFEW